MIYIPRGQLALKAIKAAKATVVKKKYDHYIIKLTDSYELSIACEDSIFGMEVRSQYFAETALLNARSNELIYDKSLGYEDVRLWKSAEALSKHIIALRRKLPNHT